VHKKSKRIILFTLLLALTIILAGCAPTKTAADQKTTSEGSSECIKPLPSPCDKICEDFPKTPYEKEVCLQDCRDLNANALRRHTECLEKEAAVDDKATAPTTEPTTAPLQPTTTVPKEGKIKLNTNVKTSIQLIDDSADIEISSAGEINYKIADDNTISGSGSVQLDTSIEGGLGPTINCEGKESNKIEYDLTGTYDPDTQTAKLKVINPKPASIEVDSKCKSDDLGELNYQTTVPVLINQEAIPVDLTKTEPVKLKLKHIIPDWDTEIEATWTMGIVLSSEFDFGVYIEPQFVEVTQGQVALVQVNVPLLTGQAKDVTLKSTQWRVADITEQITPTTVKAGLQAQLQLITTCNTGVDDYLYTVTGETTGTFRTHADSFTLKVLKDPAC